MQQGFFDVTPDDLGLLAPELAVAVTREMIWAEVSELGIPITDADVPFDINAADGGVDAVVKANPKSAGRGLIFPPQTRYQVKAGKFSLITPGEIEELLMRPGSIAA